MPPPRCTLIGPHLSGRSERLHFSMLELPTPLTLLSYFTDRGWHTPRIRFRRAAPPKSCQTVNTLRTAVA
jgi:hypothetical protein